MCFQAVLPAISPEKSATAPGRARCPLRSRLRFIQLAGTPVTALDSTMSRIGVSTTIWRCASSTRLSCVAMKRVPM
jgi:hypothetical protein